MKFHFEIHSFEEFVIFVAVLRNVDLRSEEEMLMLTQKLRSCLDTEGMPMQEEATTH